MTKAKYKETTFRQAKLQTNILAALPPACRNEFSGLIAEAPEACRELFYFYLRKIRINRKGLTPLHRLLFPGNGGMSLPYFGIFIEIPEFSSFLHIDTRHYPLWYETLLHEIGHAIDYLCGHKSALLNPLLRQDCHNFLSSLAWEISSDETLINQTLNNILAGKKVHSLAKDPISTLQTQISENLKARIPRSSNLIDVIGGVTKNAAIVTLPANNFGGTHDDAYWGKQAKLTKFFHRLPLVGKLVPVISPGLEFFAHCFSEVMLSNQEALQLNSLVFPLATNFLLGNQEENSAGLFAELYQNNLHK